MTAVKASAIFMTPGNRSAMEDHALVNGEKRIFVIADGFGGPTPGAVAAQTACESVQEFLVREAGDLEATLPFVLRSYFSLAGNVLFNSLIHANRKVRALNKGKGIHERGGASVLAGYMDDDLLALANVGACSAWLFRQGSSRELVMPRTLARLQDPFAEALADPALQVPLAAVGFKDDLEPEIFEVRVKPGDWLLMTTDGITRDALDQLLRSQQENSQKKAPAELCGQALEILKGIDQRAGRFSDNAALALIIF